MSLLHLVTGGAGFVGSHLVAALVARGDRVRVLDDLSTGRPTNLEGLEVGELGSGAPVEFQEGSVTDAEAVGRATLGVTGVLHEAAQVSVPLSVERPVRSVEINALGTLTVLEAARRNGVRRVVLAASSAAYGNNEVLPKHEDMPVAPLSPYAVGKVAAEQLMTVYAGLHGLHTTSLRYFNVFGPRQADDSPYTGVIAIFARRILSGLPVTINGDGSHSRDFTYVDDVVQANLRALDADHAPGRVYNVGAGASTTIEQLYRSIARLAGSDAEPSFGVERAGDVKHSLASLDRIRAELGYEPGVTFEEGLRRTFEWYRSNAPAGSR
ncbi:MAG: NAD-dependent epimerase/dehydratase family protein [Planctomycetota bacterium]